MISKGFPRLCSHALGAQVVYRSDTTVRRSVGAYIFFGGPRDPNIPTYGGALTMDISVLNRSISSVEKHGPWFPIRKLHRPSGSFFFSLTTDFSMSVYRALYMFRIFYFINLY